MSKDYWDFGAAVYPDRARTSAYLTPLARLYSPGRTVADLGCGRGEMLAVLKEIGHAPIGVDTSARSERWAREAGIPFQRQDVLEFLAAPGVAYDALFSYGLLEHLEPAAFSRLFTVMGERCRPGTEVLFGSHDPNSLQAHLAPLYGDPSHVRLYSAQTVEAELRANGFRVRETGAIPQPEQLVPSSLDPERDVERAALITRTLKDRWLRGSQRQALEHAKFVCDRLVVIESILRDVARVLNRPMDYYVFAVKETS